MTETGANTGVFESFDVNGQGEFETIAEAAGDTNTVFSYGGNSVDMIITYSDATITFDAGGDWAPGQAATVTVTDWEANKNPTSAETLSVGDETVKIPTIKMGNGGLTLAEGVNLTSGATNSTTTPATGLNGRNSTIELRAFWTSRGGVVRAKQGARSMSITR